ncbi:MAG: hypothetical protein KME26_07780 [Oscillatoria princeps RMCB-10]|nr:hypothetical protein [Oscillatoria princeps RMCB-10]
MLSICGRGRVYKCYLLVAGISGKTRPYRGEPAPMDSPKPVPLLTGLVVNAGCDRRRNCSN